MSSTAARRGRPRLTDEERADRRTDLTARAIRAVRDGGADQSLEEIAARLGISKPVLYDTFGSRTGLADAMAVQLATQMESTVVERFGPARPDGTFDVSVERIVELVVEALVGLVEREPDIYLFIVSALRGERQGLLDNALVAVLHERIRPVIALAAPSLSDEQTTVLSDGMYGLVLATLESWQTHRRLRREDVVRMLVAVIDGGLRRAEDDASGVPDR